MWCVVAVMVAAFTQHVWAPPLTTQGCHICIHWYYHMHHFVSTMYRYDKDGSPKWDLLTNIKVFEIELAENFRAGLNTYNSTCGLWLRR